MVLSLLCMVRFLVVFFWWGEASPLPSTKTVKRVLFSGHPPQRGHPATPRQLGGILGYKGSVCMGWDCWFDCGGMKMRDIWRGLRKSLGAFCWSSANLFYPRGESLPRLIINRGGRAPRQNSGGGLRRNLPCALKGHYWRRVRWVGYGP